MINPSALLCPHPGLRSVRAIVPAAALALLLALSGCNGDDIGALPEALPPPDAVQSPGLAGTWAYCEFDGTTDVSEELTFDGSGNFTVLGVTFDSVDGTCSSGRAEGSTQFLIYQVGADLTADLAGVPVTAREFDYGNSPGPITNYIIYFIDSGASPLALYFGFGDPVNDGSAPELRPTVLTTDPPFPYLRQ